MSSPERGEIWLVDLGYVAKVRPCLVISIPDILGKIYPNTPQKIKLNNEVGMDWVRRNFESWPELVEPNLSK